MSAPGVGVIRARPRKAPGPPRAPGTLRRELPHLAAAAVLLAVGIWANSGTLAPGGATLANPYVWEPCRYLLNIDHFHFKGAFLMLDGAPRERWEFSVVLRRILYPLLAYPWMKLFGFGGGGLITNVLLSAGGLGLFWLALQRRLEGGVPRAVLYLFATYPGWFYWGGLPYSYAIIVPASLLALVLLWRLEAAAGWREAALPALGLGVLYTGYDLLPFFAPAALALLLGRRRWAAAGVAMIAQLLPPLAVQLLLRFVWSVPFRNSNTASYSNILRSYLPPVDWQGWWELFRRLPEVALDNFLFANFLFVPLLFVLAAAAAARAAAGARRLLGPAEVALLTVAALVFLFNNAAPPYSGWQLRGVWIARLYQPIVGALLAGIAAAFARAHEAGGARRALLQGALAVTLAFHAWMVFGPVLGAPRLAGFVHYRFYRHAPRPVYADNLRRYGARPVGFCTPPPLREESSEPSSQESVTH